MSVVSEQLSRRRLTAGDGHERRETLADLPRGERARVLGYADTVEPCVARRLFDLGLVPGVEITTVRRAPLRDPVIYRVGDYEIALRRAQSRCIFVAAAQ